MQSIQAGRLVAATALRASRLNTSLALRRYGGDALMPKKGDRQHPSAKGPVPDGWATHMMPFPVRSKWGFVISFTLFIASAYAVPFVAVHWHLYKANAMQQK